MVLYWWSTLVTTEHMSGRVSPRVRNAAMLYATGVARSKREASKMAGLHPHSFTVISNKSDPVKKLLNDLEGRLADDALDMSVVQRTLGRAALIKIAKLMDSGNETVALKAAQDIADRSPEVSKIQRHEVATISLGTDDAKALAAALVESAKARESYADVALKGLVEVDLNLGGGDNSEG